jgi:hypothetical protein
MSRKRHRYELDGVHGGGYKQQLAAFEARETARAATSSGATGSTRATASAPTPSHLMSLVLNKVMWGFLVPTLAHELVTAACADGAAHPDLLKFIKMGSSGMHRRNVWRDLIAKMRKNEIHKAVERIKTPLAIPPGTQFEGDIDICYPHAFFAALYKCHKEEFVRRMLGGNPANVGLFWEAMAKRPAHPSYEPHPMHAHPRFNHREKGVALSLHGDGVACIACGKQWARTVETISWSSVLSEPATSSVVNFIFCMVFKSCLVKGPISTMSVLWKNFIWSLYWLYQGVWPDRDPDGILYIEADGGKYERRLTPLAGGYFGVLWNTQFDLECGRDFIELADYTSGQGPCSLCRCNDSTVEWTDCRRHRAVWLSTIWTNASFAADRRRHELFRYVPGLGISAYAPDPLHTKYIGVDGYMTGSVLMALVRHMGLAGTVMENVSQVWREIKEAYKTLGVSSSNQLPSLNYTKFQSSGAKLPYLKARGAEIKHVVRALNLVYARHMDISKLEHRNTKRLLEASMAIDDVLLANRGKYKLPAGDANDLENYCWLYSQLVTGLIKHYHPLTNLFHFTIKMHYLLHLGICGHYANPELSSCESGEDLMRVVKRLIASSAASTGPTKAANKAMTKYIRAVSFDLSRGRYGL